MMRKNQLLQKAGAFILSAALTVSCLSGIPAENANAADGTAPENWKKEIYVDFGTGRGTVTTDNGSMVTTDDGTVADTDLCALQKFAENFGRTCSEKVIPGYGFWKYDDASKDVGTVYGKASNGQKIGFDRVLPAGVTNVGGEYFRDWVFSPDGTPYTFSVDLPAGQYEVYVYTGNRVTNYNNTTLVSFADDNYTAKYDQSSIGGNQYHQDNCVYVVNVTESIAGSGCGTLHVRLFDDTIVKNTDGTYDEKYTSANTVFYGTDPNTEFAGNGNTDAAAGKIVTARLNGIEIMPVENPVYAESVTSSKDITDISVGINQTTTLDAVAKGATANATERLIYTSADPKIAAVNPHTGEVSGIAIGNTTITATTPSLTGNVQKSLTYNVSVVQPVTSVNFYDKDGNTTTKYEMMAGNTLTVTAKAMPEDADSTKVTYSLIGTNTDIAEIDAETGKITAKKSGTVTVRATSQSTSKRTANAILTITPGFEIGYGAVKSAVDVGKNVKNTLQVLVYDVENPDLLNTKVNYSSSDESIATVSEDGTVKGIKVGTATITATAEDSGQTASYDIKVLQPAKSIKVKKAKFTLNIKKTVQIKASLTPADSTDTISYKSKNPKIAKVDKKGVVTALKPGKTTITVQASSGKKTTVSITVNSPATKVKINGKAKLTMRKGQKKTLRATVTPKNSTDKVKWKSSKSKVATISSKGVVKAKSKGTTTITATAGKKKHTIKITVK